MMPRREDAKTPEDQAVFDASLVIREWEWSSEPTALPAARKILKIYRQARLLPKPSKSAARAERDRWAAILSRVGL